MKLSQEQLHDLGKEAIAAAHDAARLIATYAQQELKVEKKSGAASLEAQVVTEVDRLSQELILDKLKGSMEKFELGLLTEEKEDDHSRLRSDYFWCIDPLDGTLPFTEKREGYSVSIALVSKEGIPQLGVVVNPVDQSMYHAIKGGGAYKNKQKMGAADFQQSSETFTLVCDKSFLQHRHYEQTIDFFKKEMLGWGCKELRLIAQGGAVMNACWVLENTPACYFKFPKKAQGGGSLWDFAATTCLYQELQAEQALPLMVSDIRGNPLDLNQESLYMNHCGVIYASDKRVWEAVTRLHSKIQGD